MFVFPDGAAKVALWPSESISDHSHRGQVSKPVVVAVSSNVAAFQTSRTFTPGRELWYGLTGKIIKRIANASSCGPPLGACA
jgi:hypothetical protein